MPEFIVYHKDIAGNRLGEAAPGNLRFGWSLEGPGYCTYDLPVNNALVQQSRTRPYRTDFQLNHKSGQAVMGGFHTEIGMAEHQYGRLLNIGGKDYLHYLDRTFWPRDPNSNYRTTVSADNVNGTVFQMTNETISHIAYQVIAQGVNDAATAAISPIADPYIFQFTGGFPPPGSGSLSYRIEPGDTRSVRDHLNEIFAFNTTSANYYVRLNEFNQIPLNVSTGEFPTYGIGTTPVMKFNANPLGGNCEIISWGHKGIRGTRFFGVAQGPSSKKGQFVQSGTSLYRRWDYNEEFQGAGAFSNINALATATQADGLLPDLEIQIAFYDDPEHFSPWLREFLFPGVRVALKGELFWTSLNDTFTVTAMDVEVGNGDGPTKYTLTLNQPQTTV